MHVPESDVLLRILARQSVEVLVHGLDEWHIAREGISSAEVHPLVQSDPRGCAGLRQAGRAAACRDNHHNSIFQVYLNFLNEASDDISVHFCEKAMVDFLLEVKTTFNRD